MKDITFTKYESKKCLNNKKNIFFFLIINYSKQITFDDHKDNYRCYNIEFVVTKAEIRKFIEAITYVRSPVFFTLKIENLLNYKEVMFHAENLQDVIVHGLPITLAPLEFVSVDLNRLNFFKNSIFEFFFDKI